MFSLTFLYTAFQRAVDLPAAQRGTDGESCHFHCMTLAALCGACVCLSLFLLVTVVYLPLYAKLGLIAGVTKQMSDGKEVGIVNF